MGQQIIQQPNGKYAVWSSVVDAFVLLDCEPNEIIDEWLEQERRRLTRAVTEIVDKLNRGERPYYQFTMDWADALHTYKQVHGKDFDFDAEMADNAEPLVAGK